MFDYALKWTTGKIYLPLGSRERASINEALQQWWAAANKKQLPDIQQRTEAFRPKLSSLSQTIQLYYNNGELGSEGGSNQETLNQVKFGTSWSEGFSHFEQRLLVMIQD